jgi:hypothetical protein
MERRRRHRRRQHRPVDSDVVTTMMTTDARILLLAPTPQRTRGWDIGGVVGGRTPFIFILGSLFPLSPSFMKIFLTFILPSPSPSLDIVIQNPCFLDASIAPYAKIIERKITEQFIEDKIDGELVKTVFPCTLILSVISEERHLF